MIATIAAERAALLAVGLQLRRREQWRAAWDYTTAHQVDEPAVHQVVHITVTNPGAYPSNDAHARAVEAIAIGRGFSGISYNRLIMPGAQPYEGQPIGRRGAHTINTYERPICTTAGCPSFGRALVGGGSDGWNLNYNGRAYVFARNCGDPITAADRDAMARCLAADRLAGFVKITATLHGHRCCTAKQCPCEPAWGHMGEINDRLHAYLARGNVLEEDMPDPAEIAAATWEDNLIDDGAPQLPALPNGQERDAEAILRRVRGDVAQLLAQPITLSDEQVETIARQVAGLLGPTIADQVAAELALRLQS